MLEIATWSPLPLRQFSKGENFANNFIHCSDVARGTPLPYSQFSNGEKNAERFELKNMVLRNYLEDRMIEARVCIKPIVIIREIKARIAWSVADVKIYVENWRRF